MILGLTGGIACGKSVAGATLAAHGVPVLDADEVSHYLTKYEPAVIDSIVKAFGREILTPHGQIDRLKLGERVFASPPERAKLESILHPPIKQILLKAIRHGRKHEYNISFVAPLLIEANFQDIVDVIWVISSDERLQAERLRKDYGFSEMDAFRRINAQLPLREKEAYADYVLNNDGSLEQFKQLVMATWERTLKDFNSGRTPSRQKKA